MNEATTTTITKMLNDRNDGDVDDDDKESDDDYDDDVAPSK